MKTIIRKKESKGLSLMQTVAEKYISENPITPVRYLLSPPNGFKRNHQYRYILDMTEKFPDMQVGHKILLWGKIEVGERKDYEFFVKPLAPVKIFINEKLVYKSGLAAENNEEEYELFQYKAQTQELSVVIQCEKTKLGCGCIFGSNQIKSNPIYVTGPTTERKDIEGWVYTKPFIDKEFNLKLNSHEGNGDFLPKLTTDYSMDFQTRMNFDKQGTLYGIFELDISEKNVYTFESNIVEASFLIQDSTIDNYQRKFLKVGKYRVLVQIPVNSVRVSQHMVKVLGPDNEEVVLFSVFNKDFDPVTYLGPLVGNYDYDELIDISKIRENSFWRVDQPVGQIRIFSNAVLFGKWTYPLGVTLRGLIEFAVQIDDWDIMDYVKNHMEICTKYYEYSLWDAKRYGAPGINNNITIVDSLDDCGSFSRAVLEAMKYMEISDAEAVLDDMANYIMYKQGRWNDGTLYRVNAHMSLMENTLWADDSYMCIPFLVEYSEFSQDNCYLEEAIFQFERICSYLWNPEKKIFSHVYHFIREASTDIPWGRGNGWVLFSITDILMHLPSDDPRYTKFLEFYQEFLKGLFAAKESGKLWHQILDDPESYEETSASLIIIYSVLTAINHGWITDKVQQNDYIKELLETWTILEDKMIDEKGNLYGVCRGSGYSFSRNYYKWDLMPQANDTHGIGIALMTGVLVWIMRNQSTYETNK